MTAMERKILSSCPVAEPVAQAKPAVTPSEAGGDSITAGGTRAVVDALIAAVGSGVLGIVVDTSGSTYSKLGSIICVSPSQGRVGWISGGCLESSLEEEALLLKDAARAGFVEFDTRSDADLMFGTRIGCRGVVRIALIPLDLLPGIERLLRDWIERGSDIEVGFLADGSICMDAGERSLEWRIPWRQGDGEHPGFQLRLSRAPRLLLFGGGPEAAFLVPWMRQLGWYVALVERRIRWTWQLALADVAKEMMPAAAVAALVPLAHDATVVMNHDFELDREALESLSVSALPWIGLLGPARRRDDLLRLLGPEPAQALQPRLHAPVGLPLGGRGPEAIALAIAAELHADWNGRSREGNERKKDG